MRKIECNLILQYVLSIIISLGWMITPVNANGNLKSIDIKQELPLQLGEYLNNEYSDILRQTHSPAMAGNNSDYRQYIRVGFNSKRNEFYIRPMGNFHEGLEGLVIDKSLNILKDDFGSAPSKLTLISKVAFSIKVDGKELKYSYIENLKKYIARNTIAGKYVGKNEDKYLFTEDGEAIFPDRDFRYEVATDVISGVDYLLEVLPHGVGNLYGFKLNKNELELYKMGGPMGDVPEEKPFITLLRIGDDEKSKQ